MTSKLGGLGVIAIAVCAVIFGIGAIMVRAGQEAKKAVKATAVLPTPKSATRSRPQNPQLAPIPAPAP